ncbi:uncharacterized protein BDZ99DRAFT_470918 [Mytilinidion resinicola]|uniref:Uncharacterized protein n=1 Tax=Mytilinidion resinicola TaxID=574789 RepID=A0A6A6ZA45_9PEZI|nr:uncharacterized protein BDZ99DRAFT_470918 [Mytilinidion resinicola]KAF2817991.1 hypothetical protein BDZ99DRAFT_470918 [Mytilinidion resinicola]
MAWISLLHFRGLKTIETKDEIPPNLQHKMTTKITPFIGPSGCNKCDTTSLGSCGRPHTAGNFEFLAYNFRVLLEFNEAQHDATFIKLKQLDVLLGLGDLKKSRKEQYQHNFLRSVLESVAESIGTLSISERHEGGYMTPCYMKDITNPAFWRPSIDRPISLLCMGTQPRAMNTNLRLATLQLDAVTMSNYILCGLIALNWDTLEKDWAPGEWSAFRTEIKSDFRTTVAGYTSNRDLTGWIFEDGDVKNGAKYLEDRLKLAPVPKTYFTEEG